MFRLGGSAGGVGHGASLLLYLLPVAETTLKKARCIDSKKDLKEETEAKRIIKRAKPNTPS